MSLHCYLRQIGEGQNASALPQFSNVNLLGNCKRVIDLDTEISDGALDLRVTQQQLNSAKVPGPTIDQRGLCPPDRMRTEHGRLRADAGDPL